ncbi:hypothetical protein LEMLEM_LOCUS17889 [Lemmus lemmus]
MASNSLYFIFTALCNSKFNTDQDVELSATSPTPCLPAHHNVLP